MKDTIKKEFSARLAIVLFGLLTFWWLILLASGLRENIHNYLFGAVYGLMALVGGLTGLSISKTWGGAKSSVGRAILFLALGPLAAECGQLVFSFYNIFLGVEIPYPSLADIGFFANIPLYTIGIFYLAQISGGLITLRKLAYKIQVVIIPFLLLLISYILFLQGYEYDWSNPLKIFLDFGYPLGQAFYVSLALLTFTLTRGILGGVMKNKILFILFAFFAQYLADYNFLFQNSRGTWYNGGYGDYLYLLAYFLMSIGIIQLKTIHTQLSKG